MSLLEEFLPFIPIYNMIFFIFGVPFVLWLNNKTKSDWICLGLGILYMILYGVIVRPQLEDWIFFFFGLIVGYVTDYWGVSNTKWKYHLWDPDSYFSYYVGFAWGMVSMFTYNISKSVSAPIENFFLPGIIFIIPMIVFEWRFGQTRRDQYFLFLRALFTFLAFLAMNNLGLLFVACFVGSYIEFAGVNWLNNWLYIDTMSYIFLSFGYSLVMLTSVILISLLSGMVNIFVLIFFGLAVVSFLIDTFWAQKRVKVDFSKVTIAAEKFHKK